MFDLNRLLNVLSSRTGAAADFHRMLEWKLLRGSHEFPGPDGGTCINEAAIVAAGYPYRAVYCVKDLPTSFSRPISMLALCLNDTLEDDLRQELLTPFVTRLAGSVDTPKVEMTRAELMLQRTVAEIVSPALARAGYVELADRCRSVRTPTELVEIARRMRDCGSSAQRSVAHRRARSRGRCRPAVARGPADRGRLLRIFRDAGDRHARRRSTGRKGLPAGSRHPRRCARDRKPGGCRQRGAGGLGVVAVRMDTAKRSPEASLSQRPAPGLSASRRLRGRSGLAGRGRAKPERQSGRPPACLQASKRRPS